MNRLMEQILEQLEELKNCDICRGMTCIECETKYGDSVDCDTRQQYLTIDKCKAIVQKTIKEYEDVCRWELDKSFNFAKSECGSLDTHRIDFLKMKYCPYCSKKIQIVIK